MHSLLEFFSNDRYKILKFLDQNKLKIKDNYYVSLSQQEIADLSHHSKQKINKIMKELRQEGYISLYKNKRGKYLITNKASKVIEEIENFKGDSKNDK